VRPERGTRERNEREIGQMICGDRFRWQTCPSQRGG